MFVRDGEFFSFGDVDFYSIDEIRTKIGINISRMMLSNYCANEVSAVFYLKEGNQ
jgi:hypothetical protein